MTTEFPQSLSLLKAQAGDPLETERVQNSLLQRALDNMYALLAEQTLQIKIMSQKLDRRTAVLSPTKSFSADTYQHSYNASNRKSSHFLRNYVYSLPYYIWLGHAKSPDMQILTNSALQLPPFNSVPQKYSGT